MSLLWPAEEEYYIVLVLHFINPTLIGKIPNIEFVGEMAEVYGGSRHREFFR